MTTSAPAAVGLYSIGIRGIGLEDLLALAVAHQVPFLHLRGGPRGFDLVKRDAATLERWACRACRSVPINIITADLDLADFARPDTQAYRRASTELDRLGYAAAVLGAQAIRLLARRVIGRRQWTDLAVPSLVSTYGLMTLVELHDPEWFQAQMLTSLAAHIDSAPWLALLMDTAQIHGAWLRSDNPNSFAEHMSALVPHIRAVHISDNGEGLTGTGHWIVAQMSRNAGDDGRVEVAFEWTGADRSPQGCLARYRHAVAWWRSNLEGNR